MAMAAMIASAPSPNPMRSLQLNNNSNNNACKYLSFSLQLPLLCFANHNNSNKAATSAAGGAWRQSMFLNAKPLIKDGALRFNGKNAVLMGVPDNVLLTPCTDSSAFVGATNSPHSSSRLVFKLGTLTQDTRFLCLFRFKIFWMIPRVGNKGSDIPVETQMLLLEAREPRGSVSYVLFLPVLDGQFRSSLQGNSANELEICVESGFWRSTVGPLQSERANSLSDGGTPARFLIIDDGWQDTSNEFQKEGEPKVEGSQFGGRLVSIEENKKFRETANGLKDFVSDIKRTFGLKYVYVWHALMGYWGGLHPEAPSTKKYNPELKYPVQSPGNLANMRDLSMDCMEKYGVGAIDPTKAEEFYDDLHKYLVSQEVDGVKVDVQNLLETIAAGTGGRVFLTTHFQQALEKSIATNFKDNSIICCMGHNTDSVYSSKRSAITRASDDYYPRNPETQTLHIAAVAYNSIFFGEVMVPDWDMFYVCFDDKSRHNAAEFHAVARAVGGCPVYVSDKPGQHDFKILRRLVLPDGSVLRAKSPGRPTRDCLFIDPVMDGKSLLKIWNLNKLSGVIGVFNCQGAGSWPCMDVINGGGSVDELTGKVSPADIEYFEQEVVGGEESWTGHCAVFSFSAGSLTRLPKQQRFGVTLKSLQCDVFTVSPIKIYTPKIQFAPIGLIDMYNSGGAVEAVEFYRDGLNCRISVKGNGAGRFGAYSSQKPSLCYLNSKQQQGFNFSVEQNLFTTTIPDDVNSWDITIAY
ncbi:probable galactinol--sucrose galactosyltransferase 2 isoform X3 [Diospyros lotus]|uniref:probable galactinol--sucrose galactosyltransferase 2 isoform X3 n=1 Tax=Diospyros lotus TaxID=55363 RepID=UPI0022539F2D|nr:probable galactinol--sucrose galactosyltransferase 2 isoform X3 [Diospyros lotus]